MKVNKNHESWDLNTAIVLLVSTIISFYQLHPTSQYGGQYQPDLDESCLYWPQQQVQLSVQCSSLFSGLGFNHPRRLLC